MSALTDLYALYPDEYIMTAKDIRKVLIAGGITPPPITDSFNEWETNNLKLILDDCAEFNGLQLGSFNYDDQFTINNIKYLMSGITAASMRFTVNEDFTGFVMSNEGDDVEISWGDGTVETFEGGTNVLYEHEYAVAGTYTVVVVATDDITELEINDDTVSTAANSVISLDLLPATLEYFDVSYHNTLVSADFAGLSALLTFYFHHNTAFNQLSDFSDLTAVTDFAFNNNTAYNKATNLSGLSDIETFVFTNNTSFNAALTLTGMTGVISAAIFGNTALNTAVVLTPMTAVEELSFYGNTAYAQTLSIAGMAAKPDIDFTDCKLSVATVNALLAQAVVLNYTSGTIALEDQTPAAAPTGQGATDKAALILAGANVTTD